MRFSSQFLVGINLIATLGVLAASNQNDFYHLSDFNGTKDVTSTIVITKSGVYDFKNVLHIWKGKNWSCTGDKENGPQILRVEASNVTILNFAYVGDGSTYGSKGLGDPIHIASCGTGQGNKCSKAVKNVVLDGIYGHACEDMITIGTPGSDNITIQNSTLKANPKSSSWDKTVQVNFGTNIKFINNEFVGGKYCARLKPNTTASFTNNIFRGCNQGVRMTSKDADISPMKNGPVTASFSGNSFPSTSTSVTCNGSKTSTSGTVNCK